MQVQWNQARMQSRLHIVVMNHEFVEKGSSSGNVVESIVVQQFDSEPLQHWLLLLLVLGLSLLGRRKAGEFQRLRQEGQCSSIRIRVQG